MTKITNLEKELNKHLTTKDDTACTDREMLMKTRKELRAYIEDNKVKDTEGCAPELPKTVYAMKMAKMTMEEMASMGVQLITVNNTELFWVTSVGQLYPFNNKQAALEAEYAWLNSSPN